MELCVHVTDEKETSFNLVCFCLKSRNISPTQRGQKRTNWIIKALCSWWMMKLTFSFFFTSSAPSLTPFVSLLLVYSSLSHIFSSSFTSILLPHTTSSPLHPLFLPQWVPTSAGTVARRPRAVSSPTPASCPWPSPLTAPSPKKDSPPTTPSARGASPRATKMRVSSWRSDEKWRGGG